MRMPVYCKIDVSTGYIEPYLISRELFEQHLGGKILGARLLLDLTPPGVDVFAPESMVVINTGLLNDTGAPSSNRFNMTFKNVMTGGIASSNCGGQFGAMLKRAGFDGIMITGKAKEPVIIVIEDGDIRIEPAGDLWGLDAEQVQEKLPAGYGKLVIGPAGENLVRYACAVSGERVAGRCGAGAVLGAKKIKALIAYGTQRPEVEDRSGFDAYVKKWIHFLKRHPMTGDGLPRYGSAGLVNKANASHALPTHNFKEGHFKDAHKVSGENLADHHMIRNGGCVSCPIRCERRVRVKEKEVKGPEYETLGLFGANIEGTDIEFVNQLNYYADILGMDTISLGGTIAFAMELQEQGMADFGLHFGDTDNIIDIIHKIAYREGKYSELAEGSRILSERYGGKEFAIHSKGLELAAYEPRRSVGMGLGYATSNRGGCHLNGGYLALMESVGVVNMDAQETKGKAELTIFLQNAMEGVSAAGCCLFSLQSMVPAFLFHTGPASRINKVAGSAMLSARPILGGILKNNPKIMAVNSMMLLPHCKAITLATGIRMTTGRLLEIGDRGYNIERLYNIREGLTAKDDSLPDRITKTPQVPGRPETAVNLEVMLPVYYKIRGWDSDGIPTEARIRRLGLSRD